MHLKVGMLPMLSFTFVNLKRMCSASVFYLLLPTQTGDQHTRLDVMGPLLQQDGDRADPQSSAGLLPWCMLGVHGLSSN